MAGRPIPLDLLRLRSATAAYLSVTRACQLAAEALAQALPADEATEPARELVTQIAAALDPDRAGSPAAVLAALREVLDERVI
jgi:hypothetical protein